MERNEIRILALFSDVNFSPQLIAILEELIDRGVEVRVILIGSVDMQIATQIQVRGWDSKVICKRGKFSSLLNLLFVAVEIFRFKPRTLFASGQFATVLGVFSVKTSQRFLMKIKIKYLVLNAARMIFLQRDLSICL